MPQNILDLGIYRSHWEGVYNIANAYTYLSLVRFSNSSYLCIATAGAGIGESPTIQPTKWALQTDGNALIGPPNTIPYSDGSGAVQFLPITSGRLTASGSTPSFVPAISPAIAKRAVTKLQDVIGSSPCLAFITDDDQIMMWGQNENAVWSGMEGVSTIPQRVSLNGTKTGVWTKVYSTRYNLFALTSTGEVWGKGYNGAGQMGLGDTTLTSQRYRMLHKIPIAAVITDLFLPSGFDLLTSLFALSSTGTVWVWGNNAVGQLGLGDLVTRVTPVLNPSLSGITKMSVGGHGANAFCAAIGAASALFTWGANASGQLGQGDTVNRTLPTLVVGKTATDVNCMGFAALGFTQIITGGAVQTSGYNIQGTIGDNTIVNKSVFTATTLGHTNVTKLVRSSGDNAHAGYITSTGELWLTGFCGAGELGSGNTTQSNVYFKPTFAGQGAVVDAKIVGCGGAAGVTANIMTRISNGDVYLSGYDAHGQLGQGGATVTNLFRKVFLPEAAVDIEFNDGTALAGAAPQPNAMYALGASGRVWAWGGGTAGQLGTGHLFNSLTPVEVIVQ